VKKTIDKDFVKTIQETDKFSIKAFELKVRKRIAEKDTEEKQKKLRNLCFENGKIRVKQSWAENSGTNTWVNTLIWF
jgi:hypothetical protein